MENVAKQSKIHLPMSPFYAQRPPAPEDVLDWQGYASWKDNIWEILSDVLTEEVRQEFLDAPPEYLVGDDLSWLDDIIFEVSDRYPDIKSLLAERLSDHYRAFRAVHGTNTSDISIFLKEGLLPLDPEGCHSLAREIFLSGDFPELTEKHLIDAAVRVGSGGREGRVWFEGNEKLLLDHGKSYMVYGSEYLHAIAAHLEGHREYRRALKTRGKPTILICDVPLVLMSDQTLGEFAGCALEIIFQELLDGDDFQPPRRRGAAFCIHERLPPECIIGFYHPDV